MQPRQRRGASQGGVHLVPFVRWVDSHSLLCCRGGGGDIVGGAHVTACAALVQEHGRGLVQRRKVAAVSRWRA